MSTVALSRAQVRMPQIPVALAIARKEGFRLVRSWIFIAGALLSLALFGLYTWQSAPVLHRDDVFVSGALLPLAGATLMVANLAASRARRDGSEELYLGLASSPSVRSFGHLLSLLWAVAGALVPAGIMFGYMWLDDPVGSPRLTELLVGPLCIALAGAVGIALASWRSHPGLAPLAVIALTAVQTLLIQPIIGISATGATTLASRGPWFAPWVPMSITGRVPPELVIRPAGWHALYLAGLVTVVVAAIMLRHRRSAAVVGALATGIVLVGVASAGQLRPPTAAQRSALAALVEDPEAHQICEERRTITYCAYPAYRGWIDRWARPIEAALDLVPEHARPEGFLVQQTFGSYFEGPVDIPEGTNRKLQREHLRRVKSGNWTDVLTTGIEWGSGEQEGDYELGLSLFVAMRAVGLPTSRDDIRLTESDVALLRKTVLPTMRHKRRAREERRLVVGRRWASCHVSDQARGAAALWIAGNATEGTRATMLRNAKENPYLLFVDEERKIAYHTGSYNPLYPPNPPPTFDRIQFTADEFQYALQLLRRPGGEVSEVIAADWDRLVDPQTTTDALIARLDLEPLPSIDELVAALPDDVELVSEHDPSGHLQGIIPCP